MNIIIRDCMPQDYVHIYLLNKIEMGYEYPEEKTKEKLERLLTDDNHKIYVAVVDNKTVGYIHANNYDLLYSPHFKNIMGLAVLSDYQGNGIGKKLLESVEKWAKSTGAYGVRLVSGSTRVGAHEFYKNCGYTGNKEQRNFKKSF